MLHVTEIIKNVGLIPDGPWYTQAALDRGTAVHLATAYYDEGELDWSSVSPDVLPRVSQYARFIDEVRPEILAIEESISSPFGYCGTLDRRLVINGREGVLDIKPLPSPWHPLQLAGYAGCFPRPMKRWNLYLSDDNYRLVERTDRQDWQVFKAAVVLAQWKEKQ